jgi:hypothetical protein
MSKTLEEKVAGDLLWAEAFSEFVYEEAFDSKGVYMVEFNDDGEPVAKYRVVISLEKVS